MYIVCQRRSYIHTMYMYIVCQRRSYIHTMYMYIVCQRRSYMYIQCTCTLYVCQCMSLCSGQ